MLPMVELTIFALGILLIDLMVPRGWKWINAVGAFVGVLFAALCVWQIQSTLPRGAIGFYNSLLVDRFAIYFWYLFLAGAAISILMSVHYLDLEDEHHGEYYALLLLSVVGMMCMAAGIDIVLLFSGLELMAISTYVLVGFLRRDRRSNEAALKYLLLGAFSSGIFAYGLSLFYGISGSTNPRDIAHVGYMLLAFVAMGTSQPGSPGFNDGFKGILIYLLVYTFMNLGAFAVITSLRQRKVIGDELDDMAGLYQRAPVEAALMLLFLLSLAGIPPAAGFLGKYYIFLSLIESQHYWLASLGVFYSLFGLYYYLKIANAMLMRAPMETERLPISLGMRCAVGVTALATIVIGVYPEPFIRGVNWSLGIVQSPHVAAMLK